MIRSVLRFIAQKPGRACVYLLSGTILIGGGLYSVIETEADWFDGIWWAVVTLTTVGYGDYSPESFAGRWVAAFVMAGGIGSVAILTGLLADEIREARIQDKDETPELDDDIEHVMMIMADEMEKLRQKVSHPDVVEALRKVHAEHAGEGATMSERRSRRSRNVALVAVPVLALAFTACGGDDDETAYCVDESDRIVENRYCDDDANGVGSGAFFWYYGGSVIGNRIATGARVKGGDKVAAQRRRERPPRRVRIELQDERERRRPRGGLQRRRLMQRIEVEPRQGWPAIIEEQGLIYWKTELPDGSMMPYWHESNAYALTSDEVYEMEASVRLLMEMLVEAGDYIIDGNLFSQMGIPGWAVPRIKETWESEPPMLYGRFDFAYGPEGFKLLEYNADTPTALIETAVQWHWVQDVYGTGGDQWNMVHELLVGRWKELLPRLPGERLYLLHTSAEKSGEDFMTIGYLVETAREAGLNCELMPIEQLGLHPELGFVDRGGLRCAASSSSTPGSGWSTRSSPVPRSSGWATSRARRCGSSRSGRCCGPTRASCRSSGASIRSTRTCSRPTSRTSPTTSTATSASRCSRARARTR